MTKRAAPSSLEFPGTRIRIPVPDDPATEDEAVAGAFDELVAKGMLRGRDEPTIPAADVYRERGITPPGQRPPRRRRTNTGRAGHATSGRITFQVPRSIHRELVDRAQTEGVSVGQLLLSYISRALGQDTANSSSVAG